MQINEQCKLLDSNVIVVNLPSKSFHLSGPGWDQVGRQATLYPTLRLLSFLNGDIFLFLPHIRLELGLIRGVADGHANAKLRVPVSERI